MGNLDHWTLKGPPFPYQLGGWFSACRLYRLASDLIGHTSKRKPVSPKIPQTFWSLSGLPR